jgi:hypothetical protein
MTVTRSCFTHDEQKAFEPAEKIGIVACVNPHGQPHVSLITSIMAPRPDQITLGEFCRGLSKQYIQQAPDIAFLIMTMDRRLWRGRARWTHLRREGPEFQRYNDIPMFRYNTYFGINTVHYLDLVETTEAMPLPMAGIVASALLTRLGKGAAATGDPQRILKPFAEGLFNQMGSLKFISYIGRTAYLNSFRSSSARPPTAGGWLLHRWPSAGNCAASRAARKWRFSA